MATEYVIDGKIGIDLTATYASTSAGSTSLWPATPGEVVSTTYGGRYIFSRAESDIAQYDCVAFGSFSESATGTPPVPRAVPITTTNIAPGGVCGGGMIGFAQVAITSGNWGWIALNGNNLRVNVLIACNPKVPLYTTATAGKLDDATVSSGYVTGVTINTSAPSASAPYATVNWPKVITSNPV